jgi:hypothetical protein
MKELKNRIDILVESSNGDKNIIETIKKDRSVAPFSTENRLLAYFLSIGELSFDDYSLLCQEYYDRSQKSNQYLYLFDMAPRTFGQTWGEQHIKKLFPEFIKATKENLATRYPQFDGEFDLWIDGIRVEVKACRANSTTTKGSLSSRAYSHDEAVGANFKYHYQQLKPSCCDVFIWIGVCKDELIYWVLTSEELQQTGKLGSQHRNENTGVEGAEVFEGQVFMTEEELKPFLVAEENILAKVKEKGNK